LEEALVEVKEDSAVEVTTQEVLVVDTTEVVVEVGITRMAVGSDRMVVDMDRMGDGEAVQFVEVAMLLQSGVLGLTKVQAEDLTGAEIETTKTTKAQQLN